MIEIRDAHEGDLPAILAIYNDVVATSTAIYRDEPGTLRRFSRGGLGPGFRLIYTLLENPAAAAVSAHAAASDNWRRLNGLRGGRSWQSVCSSPAWRN